MMDLSPENIMNNNLIEEALINVKKIRLSYQAELDSNFSEELSNKLVEMDKIIEEAEKVMLMTASESAKHYSDKNPGMVDSTGHINEGGIKRLNFLNHKWFNFSISKK